MLIKFQQTSRYFQAWNYETKQSMLLKQRQIQLKQLVEKEILKVVQNKTKMEQFRKNKLLDNSFKILKKSIEKSDQAISYSQLAKQRSTSNKGKKTQQQKAQNIKQTKKQSPNRPELFHSQRAKAIGMDYPTDRQFFQSQRQEIRKQAQNKYTLALKNKKRKPLKFILNQDKSSEERIIESDLYSDFLQMPQPEDNIPQPFQQEIDRGQFQELIEEGQQFQECNQIISNMDSLLASHHDQTKWEGLLDDINVFLTNFDNF